MSNHEQKPRAIEILQPENLPLTGRHLIEASAGTGKTYNITRIYLRLIVAKKGTLPNGTDLRNLG